MGDFLSGITVLAVVVSFYAIFRAGETYLKTEVISGRAIYIDDKEYRCKAVENETP